MAWEKSLLAKLQIFHSRVNFNRAVYDTGSWPDQLIQSGFDYIGWTYWWWSLVMRVYYSREVQGQIE
ncbi:hypothetical protein TSUD_43560 [Trifolium subterraneum]|uniref:Uncharacterized protein n=1 Tax=Trifolium subterraneum TaxID=3900 RepID=A0A2Z6MI96_TRISU|nr:hypothetical protein TSUD_43560 [Trifolium subterraneum]